MPERESKLTGATLGGRYAILREVKGSIGNGRRYIGDKGRCRYCGTTDPLRFRKVAHTFPEALGNKWIFSSDECDDCNTKIFSLYDEELVKAVSPFLTLGGVKGKGNKTRQTGRTGGHSFLQERKGGRHRSIFVSVKDDDPATKVGVDPRSGMIRMLTPIPPVPFKPRHAYKALAKMGVALLPDEELPHYQKLRAWLLDVDDAVDFPFLEIAISFGSIGNAPPLVTGHLLRRTDPLDVIPHILFLFSAGSVCLQIDLMSDHKDDHIPPVPRGSIKIKHANVIGDGTGNREVRIDYGEPTHLDWSSPDPTPQPIATMVLDFCHKTNEGQFTPVFRKPY